MGGNISINSCSFIKELFQNRLIDKIETRNIVVAINDNVVNDLEKTLSHVIQYEIDWLQFKSLNHSSISNAYDERINSLKNRIST
jgi:hypothetical protein